ncbi:hypothetical protein [Enterocloster bolteae]|uniref:hypothetical protein n=1 Tax=Enterocloster bolteae TaxID=208479 RepID=UPI002A823E61|nr:hypothetical protein [Enterocloster bolteae]
MITGDISSGIYYRDLILEQIKTELKSSEDELQRMKDRLNKSSSDDLERVYNAFERFGVTAILECIKE